MGVNEIDFVKIIKLAAKYEAALQLVTPPECDKQYSDDKPACLACQVSLECPYGGE